MINIVGVSAKQGLSIKPFSAFKGQKLFVNLACFVVQLIFTISSCPPPPVLSWSWFKSITFGLGGEGWDVGFIFSFCLSTHDTSSQYTIPIPGQPFTLIHFKPGCSVNLHLKRAFCNSRKSPPVASHACSS